MDQLGGMREDMKGVVVQIGIGRVHLSFGDEFIYSTSGFTIEITTQENRGVMIAHRVLKVIEEAVDLPQLHVLVFSVPENVVVTDTDTRGMGSNVHLQEEDLRDVVPQHSVLLLLHDEDHRERNTSVK